MMNDVLERDITEEQSINEEPEQPQFKTKDYVRRAQNKYRKKIYAENPEFRQKIKDSVVNAHLKKPEYYKEKQRNYMREYRARKKTEKSTNTTEQKPIPDTTQHPLTEQIASLNINSV
jgi:hypothetical protein